MEFTPHLRARKSSQRMYGKCLSQCCKNCNRTTPESQSISSEKIQRYGLRSILVSLLLCNAGFPPSGCSTDDSRSVCCGTEVWVSRQVLREYLATLSHPQTFSTPSLG